MEHPIDILLVEDNPGDVRLIREMLAEAPDTGLGLRGAGTLESALDHLREAKADVVLLDLSLPDSRGLETFDRLWANAPRIPIIILTGLDDEETAIESVKKGAQDYLVKGQLDHRLLIRAIRYAVERRHNLDELEQRAAELADRESRLATIVTTNADGIVIADNDGIVRFVNPAGEAILDKPASDLNGTLLGYPLTSGHAAEIDLVDKGGRVRTAEMRVVAVEWDGEPGYLASLRDITQHKKTLEELEETRRKQLHMKDLFLSHVSHELRSPLAVIDQFVSILLDGIAGGLNSEQQEYLGIMSRNVSQLVAMINDLLLASRCREDRVPISCRRMAIRDVVDEVTEMFQASMSEEQLTLLTDVADDLPYVYADPIRVREVLTNLLDNASKFTPAGGTITISAAMYNENPDLVRVSVMDTGCGMMPEELEKVFGPLYQIGATVDHSRTGLGLGLFICRELVARQGGRIWADSRPGEGTSFSFTLPLFSLERLLAPIMTGPNLQGGSLALVSISLLPKLEYQSPDTIECDVRSARKIIQSCILADKDVVLPQIGNDMHGSTIFIVACADREGAAVLVGRIREQLARPEALKHIDVEVSFELLDMSRLSMGDSGEATLGAAARAIEKAAAERTDKGGEYVWGQRRSW